MIDPTIKALAQAPNYAALAVPLPSGQIMNHVMWVDATDDEIWINTEPGRPKYAAMKAAASVTVTVIDAANPYRYGEVRGSVVGEITGDEAFAHINALAHRYMGQDYPYETSGRVILRIAPTPSAPPGLTVRVVGVCGSLQRVSANRPVLEAVASFVEGAGHEWSWSTPLDQLPHFNPDLDPDDAGAGLAAWRTDIAMADAVVIVSPEYAHSVPGSLKNALDWLVGGGELYDKPVGLASAGLSGGSRALDALAQTLRAQGSLLAGRVEIDGVRPKLDERGALVHAPSLAALGKLVADLVAVATHRVHG